MKVIGLIPTRWRDQSNVVVELSRDEWMMLLNTSDARLSDPVPGTIVDIEKRVRALMNLESAVEKAQRAPDALRGMAEALYAVVYAAKKSITPPDETANEPSLPPAEGQP